MAYAHPYRVKTRANTNWKKAGIWSLLCASFLMSMGLFLDPAFAKTRNPLPEVVMLDEDVEEAPAKPAPKKKITSKQKASTSVEKELPEEEAELFDKSKSDAMPMPPLEEVTTETAPATEAQKPVAPKTPETFESKPSTPSPSVAPVKPAAAPTGPVPHRRKFSAFSTEVAPPETKVETPAEKPKLPQKSASLVGSDPKAKAIPAESDVKKPESSVKMIDSEPLILDANGRDPTLPPTATAPAADETATGPVDKAPEVTLAPEDNGVAPKSRLPKVLPEKKGTAPAKKSSRLKPKKKSKIATAKPKPKKKKVVAPKELFAEDPGDSATLAEEALSDDQDSEDAEDPLDQFSEAEREPADENSEVRTFKDTIRSIVDFNEQWEVNFANNGRYKIRGQPAALYDYQLTGQFLEVQVHEGERRIISIQPTRVRFKPVR